MTGSLLNSRDGQVSGWLSAEGAAPNKPLLVCMHGGGCNGRYFDLKGCSTLAAARARGFAVLRVNRPGHAGNAVPASPTPVAASTRRIRDFIDEARSAHLPDAAGVAVIGHSIGGAVALALAAEARSWPLRAVAVSGIGDAVGAAMAGVSVDRDAGRVDAPGGLDALLFENGGRPLSWRPLASLRRATEPWLVAEMIEIVEDWPRRWPTVAARVVAPVHLRLAEHERLWETGEAAIRRMAAALTAAPRVDAGLLPEGGHLYEASRRGPELIASQLDFIEATGGR